MPIRILLVISNSIIVEGIKSALSDRSEFEVVGSASTGIEGLKLFKEHQPDVLILGLRLPDICAADDLLSFVEVNKDIPILVYAGDPGDAETSSSLKAGAAGFLTSELSESEITFAVQEVYKGGEFVPASLRKKIGEAYFYEELTATETEVLRMIVGGLSNKEVSFALDVSENTVKTHVKHIFEKLHVSDRTSASVVAIKRGLVRVDV